jgi:TRAP-type C4-dicarboxylate transport system permease small subunit
MIPLRKISLGLLGLFLAQPAWATEIEDSLSSTASKAGMGGFTTSVPTLVSSIVSTALVFIGIFFMVLILWSGYEWMTAGGNPEKVTHAKERITNSLIGIIIVVSAYAISSFVITRLLSAVQG